MQDIEAIIRETLGTSKVAEVSLEREVNSDDQKTLRVIIAYRGEISPDETIAVIRAVWGNIEGDEVFPVVSFVSESDYKDNLAA